MRSLIFLRLLIITGCFAVLTVKADSKRVGQFTIALERVRDHASVTIHHEKKKVFEKREIGTFFNFGTNLEGKGPQILSGHKFPHLLIFEWNGGAHCCFYLHIIELGDASRKIITVDGGSNDFKLLDLDQDGIAEIEFWDAPIDYVFSSFAGSPQGRVVLKYDGKQYIVHSEVLRKPPPRKEEVDEMISNLKRSFLSATGSDLPYPFLKVMMDLSYSGHLRLALDIAEKSWPSQRNGLQEFKDDFTNLLKNSKYWPQIGQVISL